MLSLSNFPGVLCALWFKPVLTTEGTENTERSIFCV